MKKPALLLIDMQNDFVLEDAPLPVAQGRVVIPKIRELLDGFRAKKFPVFHVIRVHRPDGSDVEIIRQEDFRNHPFAVEGTHGAAVVDELTPLAGEYVIPKIRMSAFIGTELDLMLRNLGVTGVVVTGIQTPNCIRTTIYDAIAYNYSVVAVSDAIGAQSDAIHQANLRDMTNIGVSVMRARDVLAGLP
ncbi:MAG: cysteine hydrolase [Methanoregula sp.]|jgi:nicotinamidase-related amidase|nr:cysteine hydrolase [Methanoregula sp.]